MLPSRLNNTILVAVARRGGLWLFCIAIALTVLSCNRRALYAHYVSLPATGWLQTDTLHFCVTLPPCPCPAVSPAGSPSAAEPSVLALCLRTTALYPYTDLTVTIRQHTHSHRHSTTLRLPVTDSEGHALGNGVGIYQYTFPLRSLRLAPGDTLHVDVSHAMRRSPLPGITDVGLTLNLTE